MIVKEGARTRTHHNRTATPTTLEHPGRKTVFTVICDTPGSCLSRVAARAGMPLSTARHHVRVLEANGFVSEAKIRGKRRLYRAETADHELAAALNDEATAAVLQALARLGPTSVSELAMALNRDPSTITHHLQRLRAADLVVREREGRAVINRLSPGASTALASTHATKTGQSERLVADGSGFDTESEHHRTS